ncbi:hypothetical protein N0V84_000932 [Fusarium piperis]|uniref:Uncharacterized protein n=1 Tax=Fusarium piperis TaxID=1435070 RepID=A0A9W8WMG4_9HYPO|nr:hypothetical protein N0V84_000932 [Fusarium piperis]
MDTPFDPIRCAELHNRLLAKAITIMPGAFQEAKRDVLTRWLALPPEKRRIDISENKPLYTFLSLIKSYLPDELPLTAEYCQPEPWWFDNNLQELDDRRIILLYADGTDAPKMDAGLYFNLDTNLVHWTRLRGCGLFPPDEDWVPLELALQKALEMWYCDKFTWGGKTGWYRSGEAASYASWAAPDVVLALDCWDFLLESIRSRLPEGAPRLPPLKPLPWDFLDQFQVSSFAKMFLSGAKRPSFKHVAPGITTFTPETFAAIYGAKPSTSRCLQTEQKGGFETISLILPSTAGPIVKSEDEYLFDGEDYLPLADTKLYEHPGLYTTFVQPTSDGDATDLVTAQGAMNPVRYHGFRPWGPGGNVRLVVMLRLWITHVVNGTWEVGPEGISTPISWFTDVDTTQGRRLLWTEDCR